MNNNKQSMKLYTEEQVRKAINDGSLYSYINGNFEFKNSEDDIINSLTPIEIPSDEEITKGIDENIPIDEKDMWSERFYFTIGAKWMRDKIQGGNK